MRSRILVVGRDVALRARLVQVLAGGGYRVELAESAIQARQTGLKDIALAILVQDGKAPVGDRSLEELEAATGKVLVVADAADGPGLLARVGEALRPEPQVDDAAPTLLRFADYALDLAGHSLSDQAGNEVPLTRGEYGLLREFVQRPGRVLSRDHLLQALAGRDAESFDRSIDMLIVRLRRKIERDPKNPSLIVTVPGAGYKFAARVTTADATVEPAAALAAVPPQPAPVPAERRQVTALCAEVIQTQSGGAPADPEDLPPIIDAFRLRAAAVLTRHGGVVARSHAREVVAYFGHPAAQEDAPERAIHAALELTRDHGKGDADIPTGWAVRAGIATGLVIAGHGGDLVGEAPSEATSLQAVAKPGQVLVTPGTRRLVGRLFDYEAVAQAWRVVAENRALGRFEALRSGATPMVARDEELDLLLRRWRQAREGGGRVVLISGEPGIGKSRLTAALLERLAAEPHTPLRYFCSPQHTDSAFYPIIGQLERAAGLTYDDTAQAKLDKVDAMLAQGDRVKEYVTND